MFAPYPPPLRKTSSLSSITHSRKQEFSRNVFPEQASLIQNILEKSKSSIRNYLILKTCFMLKTILCTCWEQYKINSTEDLKQFALFIYNLYKNFAAKKIVQRIGKHSAYVADNKYYWVLLIKKLFKEYTTRENRRQTKSWQHQTKFQLWAHT